MHYWVYLVILMTQEIFYFRNNKESRYLLYIQSRNQIKVLHVLFIGEGGIKEEHYL